ncbi:MAG: hypothetical protein RJA61_463 [Candidatus Parcubacteria bacterium]
MLRIKLELRDWYLEYRKNPAHFMQGLKQKLIFGKLTKSHPCPNKDQQTPFFEGFLQSFQAHSYRKECYC